MGFWDKAKEAKKPIAEGMEFARRAAEVGKASKENKVNSDILCTCGEPIRQGDPFCLWCGRIMRPMPTVDASAIAEYEAQVQRLTSCIHANAEQSRETLWDAVVQKFISTVGTVKPVIEAIGGAVSTEAGAISFDATTRKIDDFVSLCRRQKFELALVGAVKAGKSTLINALFERELASTSVVPETAALTKFRSAAKNYVQVNFYSAEEWSRLWKTVPQGMNAHGEYLNIFMSRYKEQNAEEMRAQFIGADPILVYCEEEAALKGEIEKWTSAQQPSHYFVKEVEVGLADFDLPSNVVLVDTPGMDDPVTYRSDITKSYIDSANAVLVCVKASSLTETELQTIRGAFANTDRPGKIYIIGTQLDLLNPPVHDNWKLQWSGWVQLLRLPEYFGNTELAKKNILGVAAYLYTLGWKRKNGIELTENEKLTLMIGGLKFNGIDIQNIASIEKLMQFTGIFDLKQRLQSEVILKAKELLSEEINYRYRARLKDITRLLSDVRSQQLRMLDGFNQEINAVEGDRERAVLRVNAMEATEVDLKDLLSKLAVQAKAGAAALTEKINEFKRA